MDDLAQDVMRPAEGRPTAKPRKIRSSKLTSEILEKALPQLYERGKAFKWTSRRRGPDAALNDLTRLLELYRTWAFETSRIHRFEDFVVDIEGFLRSRTGRTLISEMHLKHAQISVDDVIAAEDGAPVTRDVGGQAREAITLEAASSENEDQWPEEYLLNRSSQAQALRGATADVAGRALNDIFSGALFNDLPTTTSGPTTALQDSQILRGGNQASTDTPMHPMKAEDKSTAAPTEPQLEQAGNPELVPQFEDEELFGSDDSVLDAYESQMGQQGRTCSDAP